jgi:hypothetical protein
MTTQVELPEERVSQGYDEGLIQGWRRRRIQEDTRKTQEEGPSHQKHPAAEFIPTKLEEGCCCKQSSAFCSDWENRIR